MRWIEEDENETYTGDPDWFLTAEGRDLEIWASAWGFVRRAPKK